MYKLKKLNEFKKLENCDWEFIKMYFDEETVKDFILFAESPGNDPLCINIKYGEIYLFSHDPVKSAKVFNTFNDFLLNEIIGLQELMGDMKFDNEKEKSKALKALLPGNDIDYDFRFMKLG